jgi:hypothetical protein
MRRGSVCLADVALRGDARPGRLAPQLISPQIGCHVPAGRAVVPHQHRHAGRDQPEGDRYGRLRPGGPAQRHRPPVGPGRFTHPGRAGPRAGHSWVPPAAGCLCRAARPRRHLPSSEDAGAKEHAGAKIASQRWLLRAKHRNGPDTHPTEGIMDNCRFRAIGGRCPRTAHWRLHESRGQPSARPEPARCASTRPSAGRRRLPCLGQR